MDTPLPSPLAPGAESFFRNLQQRITTAIEELEGGARFDLQPWLPVSEAAGIFMPKVAGQVLCKKYTDGPTGEFWSGGHECQPVHLLKISQLARVTPTL